MPRAVPLPKQLASLLWTNQLRFNFGRRDSGQDKMARRNLLAFDHWVHPRRPRWYFWALHIYLMRIFSSYRLWSGDLRRRLGSGGRRCSWPIFLRLVMWLHECSESHCFYHFLSSLQQMAFLVSLIYFPFVGPYAVTLQPNKIEYSWYFYFLWHLSIKLEDQPNPF